MPLRSCPLPYATAQPVGARHGVPSLPPSFSEGAPHKFTQNADKSILCNRKRYLVNILGQCVGQIANLPYIQVIERIFTTGHFFKETKISYTESAEKAQRYTEMLKIG